MSKIVTYFSNKVSLFYTRVKGFMNRENVRLFIDIISFCLLFLTLLTNFEILIISNILLNIFPLEFREPLFDEKIWYDLNGSVIGATILIIILSVLSNYLNENPRVITLVDTPVPTQMVGSICTILGFDVLLMKIEFMQDLDIFGFNFKVIVGAILILIGISLLFLSIGKEYVFIIPSFAVIISFTLYPVFIAFILALYENPTVGELRFIEDYYKNFSNIANYHIDDFAGDLGLAGFDVLIAFIAVFAIAVILSKNIGERIIDEETPPAKMVLTYLVISIISIILGPLIVIGVFKGLVSVGEDLPKLYKNFPRELPLDKFKEVLISKRIDFVRILFNTVFWTGVCVFFHVTLGIGLALVLNREFKGRTIFRSVFILPWAIPSYISALVWRNFIYHNENGILGKGGKDFVDQSFRFTLLDFLLIIIIIALLIFIASRSSIIANITLVGIGFIGVIAMIMILTSDLITVVDWTLFWYNPLKELLVNLDIFRLNDFKIIYIERFSANMWVTTRIKILGVDFLMMTFAAIMTNIWLGVPFMMLSFLAALQSIPQDLYDAAKIDGANSMTRFWNVTWPLLKPTLMTVSLLGIIWTFNLFTVFYILSQNQQGLPERSVYDIFVTFIYDQFDRTQYAQASALSFSVFIMLIGFSIVYRRILRAEQILEE
ncbi:MAG: carbohydrate ABC transporter permease [Candidatus Hodarchaeota archaeon]